MQGVGIQSLMGGAGQAALVLLFGEATSCRPNGSLRMAGLTVAVQSPRRIIVPFRFASRAETVSCMYGWC